MTRNSDPKKDLQNLSEEERRILLANLLAALDQAGNGTAQRAFSDAANKLPKIQVVPFVPPQALKVLSQTILTRVQTLHQQATDSVDLLRNGGRSAARPPRPPGPPGPPRPVAPARRPWYAEGLKLPALMLVVLIAVALGAAAHRASIRRLPEAIRQAQTALGGVKTDIQALESKIGDRRAVIEPLKARALPAENAEKEADALRREREEVRRKLEDQAAERERLEKAREDLRAVNSELGNQTSALAQLDEQLAKVRAATDEKAALLASLDTKGEYKALYAPSSGGRGALPPDLEPAFELPSASKDAYDNPVRAELDSASGWPLEIRHKGTGMHFVLIPAGEFMMGSDDRKNDEKTVHKVKITKPFYLGKYEVTQAEWEKVMGRNPSNFKSDRNPVEQVSWDDCQKFIKKLNTPIRPNSHTPTPFLFALPTEAEWEYACRAGTTTRFSFGDEASSLGDYGWYSSNSGSKTHPAGEKKPNAWGLYDLHGNVWEWCEDWYGDYPRGDVTDPTGADGGGSRVVRGGSWSYGAANCRSANRGGDSPDGRRSRVGCRLSLRSSP